jgi:hypothetical protein
MTILDDFKEEITQRVEALEPGAQFSLRTLFGGREEFAKLTASGRRKVLGAQFRRAVEEADFQNIEYSHHAQSPAEHWYQRV